MMKLQRELKRLFPFATIEITDGSHLRIRLPNGKSVFTAMTPSDRRALRNLRADVRRRMKEDTVGR